jgi:hypothetical protein
MGDASNEEKFDKGKEKQVIGGQQSHRSEYGGQGDQTEAAGQPIGGTDSATGSGTALTQGAEFGGQAATGSGSEPRRSMGTHGDEFGQMSDYDRSGQQGQSSTGQADLGSQAGSTLGGRSDQQDLDVDQPGRVGGASDLQGEGFILSPGSGSDDLQQRQSPSSAEATGGSDFAREGRGALDEDEEMGGES